jgi:hypothetical protein
MFANGIAENGEPIAPTRTSCARGERGVNRLNKKPDRIRQTGPAHSKNATLDRRGESLKVLTIPPLIPMIRGALRVMARSRTRSHLDERQQHCTAEGVGAVRAARSEDLAAASEGTGHHHVDLAARAISERDAATLATGTDSLQHGGSTGGRELQASG